MNGVDPIPSENGDPSYNDPSDDNLDHPPPDLDTNLPSDSESDEPPPCEDDNDPSITLESMRANFRFVQMVREATLETQFSQAELHSFRNPQESHFSPSDDPDLRLSMRLFMSTLDHLTSQ